MSLTTVLDYLFDDGVQFRGRNLLAGGTVKIGQAGASRVNSRVHGGTWYDVSLSLHENLLEIWCDCPYFADRGPCKHLWATILECDRRRLLTDLLQVTNLEVVDAVDAFEEGDEDFALQPPQTDNRGYFYRGPAQKRGPQIPPWQEYLNAIEQQGQSRPASAGAPPSTSEILYVIDVLGTRSSGKITLELHSRSRKKNGEWTRIKEFRATAEQVAQLPDPMDADIVGAILGGQQYYTYYSSMATEVHRALTHRMACKLLPQVAAAGRLYVREGGAEAWKPVAWDAGVAWQLWLEVKQDERDQWAITGSLRRGEDRMDLSEPLLLLASGLLIARGAIAAFDDRGSFSWVSQLREVKRIPFPDRERDAVMGRIMNHAVLPPMEVDEALQFKEERVTPKLGFKISQQKNAWGEVHHVGSLLVDYGRGWKDAGAAARGSWFPEDRVYVVRDAATEDAARATLQELGLRPDASRQSLGLPEMWTLSTRSLPRAVRQLIQIGWHVEAEGKAFRRPGATRVDVRSGIDWFELHGEVDYEGSTVSLPQLLAAVRRGDSMVVLGDGTFGLLPEEWLERFAPMAGLGEREDDHIRFRQNQAGLLDALLAAQPDVQVDEVFRHVRERMQRFDGVKALEQPAGFVGQLRQYQCEGLGWMEFLREFGFGGCLADDMGVGKTAQVLATLEARRAEGHGPSLAVVPKSVMFNWRQEAERFTPKLRVLEHIGSARDLALIDQHDLILTTYGTMLRDALPLSQREFDYVVLDEAQAVKNATTASAKAVRLLKGKHRLALSGTPVENHLGELWSLFEFLNPGMLGEAKVLKMAGGLARNPSEETRKLLGQALRPFILRRTKQQVARELPAKTEQTIFCELEGAQKKQYEELRDHFRRTLLKRVGEQGLGRSKMQVLEALLRLRQAACHPGLLDETRVTESSAKLDVLMAQLTELREEGHKALVFSQFTSLLAIVRRRLDDARMRYEYLDGATRNRQAHVETFQNDPDCGLFLISLKAGGLGLNLTAAEYVFLLDPWWNPAVEAQAVDRAHRIGQTKPVFAYRLIARDTVEEKVLELQKTKRELADAILSEDNSLIRDLKREDLELLLS